MSIELNGSNDIVRRNGNLPDEVLGTKSGPSVTAEELAFLESLPPQSKLKQAYLESTLKTVVPGYQVPQIQALVSGAGNPTDLLTGTLQRVTITGAISTTATQAATASGTYYKARVAWNNNGASASAKVRIAVNADNDTHGLMIGQNVKRRDYEMTMGDSVMLVCGVPITRLTFSADGAITGGTHQLQVTFGN